MSNGNLLTSGAVPQDAKMDAIFLTLNVLLALRTFPNAPTVVLLLLAILVSICLIILTLQLVQMEHMPTLLVETVKHVFQPARTGIPLNALHALLGISSMLPRIPVLKAAHKENI
jgi:hypothetical protein